MAKNTYAIMGATGQIGHKLTEELLKKGHKVRALGRDRQKLQELKAKGAEIIAEEFDNSASLGKAFSGCKAVFTFIPPAYHADDMEVFQERTAEAIVQAIAHAKVPYVLNLSALGANLIKGTGPIKELHHQEDRLNLIPNLNVLHFRPSYFMENLLWSLPTIKSSSLIATPLKPTLQIPMVATRDISQKIAEHLHTLAFQGSSVFEFTGPEAITMVDAAKILGKPLGKPELKYKQLSYETAEKEMIEAGFKHQVSRLLIEMYRAMNEGKIRQTQVLTADHKGKTTLDEFAKAFAQIYRSAKAA